MVSMEDRKELHINSGFASSVVPHDHVGANVTHLIGRTPAAFGPRCDVVACTVSPAFGPEPVTP